MQVTDEMVDAGLRITLSSVGLPAGECLHATDVREILTAALSAEQTQPVAVKALEWEEKLKDDGSRWRWVAGDYGVTQMDWHGFSSFDVSRGQWLAGGPFATLEAAKAAAQSDYETRIRSALVDVPAEPVAWRYRHVPTVGWSYSDTAHPRDDLQQDPLYASPPLSREGEDTAEVYERCAKLAEERAAEVRYASWAVALKRLAQEIRALAATRSASATASSGGDHG